MVCSGGKVYMPCGPAKGQPICGSNTEIFDEETCMEGCYCPKGTVLHETKCITKDMCPCRLRGKDFPPGFSVPKDCNTCTCVEGQWVCTQVCLGFCFHISILIEFVCSWIVVVDVQPSVILITRLLMGNDMILWDNVRIIWWKRIIFQLKLKMWLVLVLFRKYVLLWV